MPTTNGYMQDNVAVLQAKGRMVQRNADEALVRVDRLRRSDPESEELDYAERRLNDMAERLVLINEALHAKGAKVIE